MTRHEERKRARRRADVCPCRTTQPAGLSMRALAKNWRLRSYLDLALSHEYEMRAAREEGDVSGEGFYAGLAFQYRDFAVDPETTAAAVRDREKRS